MGLAAVAALGVGTAGMQMYAGQQQSKALLKQGEFNAQVYEQQAGMIQEQKKLADYQYNRQAAKVRGSIVSHTAGAGLELGGSPMSILIDNETQMLLDKAVGDYNYDVQSNYAKSGAINQRMSSSQNARLARITGYTNAFSSALNTAGTAGKL